MTTVQIVLFDGFDLMDALAPYEVFAAASQYSSEAIQVELVTAEGARSVASGTNGLTVQAGGRLEPEREGIVLVPGAAGGVTGHGPDTVVAILNRASETELVPLAAKALAAPGVTVATVCGGSLLLAMKGLLEGRHAVTHHMGMDALSATGAIPVRARVVDDGNLVSSGGVTSGLDVALYLTEREWGPRIAHAVETLFEYEKRGTVWQARGLAPAHGTEAHDAAVGAIEPADGTLVQTAEQVREETTASSPALFVGQWQAVIATPIGKLQVELHIEEKDGRLQGTAVQGGERAEMIDPAVQGSRLTWQLKVTKPMRLHLKFDVNVQGDRMSGTAKAGMLPPSKVAGERVAGV